MSNKSSDENGFSWQNYGVNGTKVQENSKTREGEHSWYNNKTGLMGWHGANASAEDKKFTGDTKNFTK